ncbi:zinc-binding alcohol dehydrogenase family protein [Crateriforma conspicua]|uniref:Putative L-galactonate oxidoreductase n=1 Tax=Crateriforma conspicua TaxID=2527996 RepID=A0A5C5YB01_9PLAN|nr:zinc-binding alcohol dehydrogenase family protein [Crateriforma conspicua]TWT72118.1 putative L-galactonate oxidoreductase [Crateriforma conspicua]
MKALQLSEPKRWEIVDIQAPGKPGPGEAVVKIHRVGVCGTDLGGYLGKFPFFSYPRIPGHELGVEVVAVGEGVKNVSVGQFCAVEPYINCQQCYSCRRGFTNCCEHHQTLGVMCDGGLAEQMTLPARKLHPSGNLTMDQAALVETLAIGCHAVDRSKLQGKENILILGAGPIGLSALEFAKLTGARVIIADLVESRLEFVRQRMGVQDTIQIKGDDSDIEAIGDLTDGQFADVVIDATGHNGSMVRSMEFAAFAGRVVYVGITQQNLDFPHAAFFHRRELNLMASRNALSPDFPRIIRLIDAGIIDTQPWITHHASFNEVPDVFESWTRPETGVIKAVIEV